MSITKGTRGRKKGGDHVDLGAIAGSNDGVTIRRAAGKGAARGNNHEIVRGAVVLLIRETEEAPDRRVRAGLKVLLPKI